MSDNLSTTSLVKLGFTIETIEEKDEKGNEWVFKVTPPPYYIKKTKRGTLQAYRNMKDKTETTIHGLSGFKVTKGDLIGKRFTTATKTETAA